jgi:hypothetical protein
MSHDLIQSEPIEKIGPLIFAVIWILFTTVHCFFMMRGFSGAWPLLVVLSLFYSVFFFVGFWLIRLHVQSWLLRLKFGRPALLMNGPLALGQTVQFELSGFKTSVTNDALALSLVVEKGSKDSDGDTSWSPAWRSTSLGLHIQPDPTGTSGSRHARSSPLVLQANDAFNAETNAQLRWSVQMHELPINENNLKRGWRFPLAPSAVVKMGHEPLHKRVPATASEIAVGVRSLAFVTALCVLACVGLLVQNVFFSMRFSTFQLIFSVMLGTVAYVCFKVRRQMQQTGKIEAIETQRQEFSSLFKFLPILFSLHLLGTSCLGKSFCLCSNEKAPLKGQVQLRYQ